LAQQFDNRKRIKGKKMKRFSLLLICAITVMLTGCATSQNVTLAMANPPAILSTASLSMQDGNSADMDIGISQQFQALGIAMKSPVTAGVTRTGGADMIVAYNDVWRWDIVMYLKSLNINIFDAKSGNLLVTGRWENSVFHGFQNYKDVIRDLSVEMMNKVKAATPVAQAGAPIAP
jgi:hypothetical protein